MVSGALSDGRLFMTDAYEDYYAILLLLMAVAANWTFFVPRRFAVLPPPAGGKTLAWHALEWLVSCASVLLVGLWMEQHNVQPHSQGWAFYTVLFCLFLTLAFPGFVWRFLRRKG